MIADYAHMTQDQKKRIIAGYHEARSWNCPPDQSVAIAARRGFELTNRQWNGVAGANAFAAACATLIMAKVIDLRQPIEDVIA